MDLLLLACEQNSILDLSSGLVAQFISPAKGGVCERRVQLKDVGLLFKATSVL